MTSPDSPPSRGAYTSPLRTRQKAQTATLILEAVGTVLQGGGLDAVTIAEVARTAEVTERTIYRHFATREDLLRAFWKWQLERSGGDRVIAPETVPALLETIRRLFASLDADEAVIRAVLSAPEGREVRRVANQTRLAHMLGFVERLVPDLPERERHNLASGIISVCSVLSWMFMRDNCGYDGARAGEAAAQAVAYMLEAAQARAPAVTQPGRCPGPHKEAPPP